MKHKRIIGAILILSVCLLISVSASNNKDAMRLAVNTRTDSGDPSIIANMGNANVANTHLQAAFDELFAAKTQSKSAQDIEKEDKYPPYYSGTYVNRYGELVVLLNDKGIGGGIFKGKKEQQAKDEIMRMAKTDKIVFGKTEYSYNELSGVMADVKKFLQGPNAKSAPFIIRSGGTRQSENRVYMYMSSVEPSDIAWFRENISSSDCIVFTEMGDGIEATASVLPGGKITAEGDSGGFSVGFRARKGSSTLGFVTVAHPFVTVSGLDYGETISIQNSGSDTIGTSKVGGRQFSDKVDAAFIEKASSTTVTNTVYDASGKSYTMSSGYDTPLKGTTIYMCGQATQLATDDLSVGRILEIDAIAGYKGVNIFDLYFTNYYSRPGDSGGIAFVNGAGYSPAGIQVAREPGVSGSYVCKAKNIVSALGVTPY